MGQFVSSNRNDKCNDELVNTLIKREYIHSTIVEKVFRCVDRGLYHTDDNKLNVYRDSAWQSGDIHLSAPSVYATVLECLDLHKGEKFLNIGSGIGYFSTIAGLLLGVNGVNHGIEVRAPSINIAYQKLEEFRLKSAAIDYFEFCEPLFIEGNACELLTVGYYDKVYCGAGVPPAETSFMKALIKVGGVLVMPLEGFLVKVIRKSEYSWKTIEVLEVSFTDLVVPDKCSVMKVTKFPSVEPASLQELCRSNIRSFFRDSLNKTHPGLKIRTKCKPSKSYDDKFFNSDPLSQFVRIQYGATEGGMVSLRNIVDTFAGLDEAISDLGSTSENEAVDEDNNGNDRDDDEEKNTSEQRDKSLPKKTESDAKRKSSEAGCSEQNKTSPGKPENTKRMRMNTSSSTAKSFLNSQSTNSGSSLWDTLSSDSSDSDDSDDGRNLIDPEWLASMRNNAPNGLRHDDFGGIYNSLFNGDNIHDSDTESDIARELVLYRFLNERKENELSKFLKGKIDKLPIPAMLKQFLNYNKED
ncbi:protein-L-isoaspartate O-methyltransferase domain-containing protein 2-like [Myzus persicae]|uniref:protein-L-isoaspartate O-methyltransferase domain-containing protein 2-like n=1 Tax=Myzus persicae TaxID=13164 RepID=UPI000B938D70|nr:protein-L-isoaspartate O-methyltransferase domain-containing protein 2-like [Myzus persicae]